MSLQVVRVQIYDQTPSANGVKVIVRSILWGLVETVQNVKSVTTPDQDHLKEISNCLESTRNCDDSLNADSNDGSSTFTRSQAERDHEANFLSAAEFTLKSLLEKEIEDATLEGIIGNVHYLDDDCQLPLSFGKQLKPLKIKKNKKKKYNHKSNDMNPSFNCPVGFIWNFELPAPPSSYVEDNVYHLCLPGKGTASSPVVPNGDHSAKSSEEYRIVRVVGCGPSLIQTPPLVEFSGDECNPDSAKDTEIDTRAGTGTVTVDVISECGLVEKRMTVLRNHLLTIEQECLMDTIQIVNSAIHHTPQEDNTHEGASEQKTFEHSKTVLYGTLGLLQHNITFS